MTTPNRPPCPLCERPVTRLQRSAPKGTVAGDVGPVSAYPCSCWLTHQEARLVARGHLTVVQVGA